jgi:hypothetical protein
MQICNKFCTIIIAELAKFDPDESGTYRFKMHIFLYDVGTGMVLYLHAAKSAIVAEHRADHLNLRISTYFIHIAIYHRLQQSFAPQTPVLAFIVGSSRPAKPVPLLYFTFFVSIHIINIKTWI